MTLTHLEMLQTRAIDGLATASELAELQAASIDVQSWKFVRTLLLESVATERDPELWHQISKQLQVDDSEDVSALITAALACDESVELSDIVMAALGLTDDVQTNVAIRDALNPCESPELVAEVFDKLGLTEADGFEQVSDLLTDTAPPELVGDVFTALGLPESGVSKIVPEVLGTDDVPELADSIFAELGLNGEGRVADSLRSLRDSDPAPDLWEGISASIGLDEAGAPSGTNEGELIRFPVRFATASAMVAAAAAALLILVTGNGLNEASQPTDLLFGEINEVDIEQLEYSQDVMVQIIADEADAMTPTIIFINELEAPMDDEGMSL